MAISTETRFFGMDLHQLKADIFQTWRSAPAWPPLVWLRPEQALLLIAADGQVQQVWESGQPLPTESTFQPVFVAIELPEPMVLRKNMQLPPLDPQDCASAAQLEAEAISPFPAADLLWGFTEISRSTSGVRLQLVLAQRAQVQTYVSSKMSAVQAVKSTTSAETDAAPEVWVLGPQRQPIVLPGFGEAVRRQSGRQKMLRNVGGVVLAGLLLLALAITPTLQLRMRAIEAVRAYDTLHIKTMDVVAKRAQLMQGADRISDLSDMLAERIDAVKVLSVLTGVIPDDTALQSMRIQGSKATISGLTDNASGLMQKLSNQDGIKDVKAPSAANRLGGSINKESFSIELTLDPKVFGPLLKKDMLPALLDPSDASRASTAATSVGQSVAPASTSSSVVPGASAPAVQDAGASTGAGGNRWADAARKRAEREAQRAKNGERKEGAPK